MKNFITSLLIITTASFMLFPSSVLAQEDANLKALQDNVNRVTEYEGWFLSDKAFRDAARVTDYWDDQNYPQGIRKFYSKFSPWYHELKYDGGSKFLYNDEDEGEKFGLQFTSWANQCQIAADLMGKEGRSFKDVITKLNDLAKGENTTDKTRAEILKYSNEMLDEAFKLIKQPSCIYAYANIISSLDEQDIECLARKLMNPTRNVINTHTKTQYSKVGGCRKTTDYPGDFSETLVTWPVPIPGCVGGFRCQVSMQIASNAKKWYPYKSGSSSFAQTWNKYVHSVDGQLPPSGGKKNDKGTLDKAYKKLEEFGGNIVTDTEQAVATAGKELEKGSVVGLSLPLSDISIPGLIRRIINQILGVVGALGLAAFIYGGILYMTASGNAERAEKGRKTIVWATLGLVMIFSAYAITSFLIDALIKK